MRTNMINRQMTPFFSSTLSALSVGIFNFYISRTQNSVSGVPSLHYVLVCKIHIYVQKVTLWNLLTNIFLFFFYRNLLTFGMPILLRSHGPTPKILEMSQILGKSQNSVETQLSGQSLLPENRVFGNSGKKKTRKRKYEYFLLFLGFDFLPCVKYFVQGYLQKENFCS